MEWFECAAGLNELCAAGLSEFRYWQFERVKILPKICFQPVPAMCSFLLGCETGFLGLCFLQRFSSGYPISFLLFRFSRGRLSHFLSLLQIFQWQMDPLDVVAKENDLGSLDTADSDDKYHTYEFEFVPGFSMQSLPVLFLADFYNNMPPVVRLLDPLGNVFVVSIKHRPSRVYLNHGSTRIEDVYNLLSGGWITLKFMEGVTFEMTVRDRLWNQVSYPFPPKNFGLGEPNLPMRLIHEDEDEFLFIDSIHFHHSLTKTVSIEETNTPFLFLHIGFCQFAFSPAATSITLVNFRGRKWKCKFQWQSSKRNYCCVSEGWGTFRGLNGLLPGTSLKLGVAKKNRKYLFVKVVED